MKRFGIAFVLTMLVAELLARLTMATTDAPVLRWHDQATQLKVAQLEVLDDTEIVIVGTSMAQQDIVPSSLAASLEDIDGLRPTVYNAALNGGVPVVMEKWLMDEVLTEVDPTTVIWGLSALDISLEYGDATLDAYDAALETRPGFYAATDRLVSRFSTLIADRRTLRDPDQIFGDGAEANRRAVSQAESEVGPDGERRNFVLDTRIQQAQEMTRRITPFQIDRDDLAAITRTVRELQARGIDVVFVELPVPNRFRQLYPDGPEQHELVPATISALADELGVDAILLDASPTDLEFVDFTHLDAQAADEFSTTLGQALGSR